MKSTNYLHCSFAAIVLNACAPAESCAQSEGATEHAQYTVETFSGVLDGGSGGMSIDKEGNVYVADFGRLLNDPSTRGKNVFKIAPDGTATIFATGFEGASGNEIDENGVLYQSNIAGNFIAKIQPNGEWEVLTREGLKSPVGIVMDAEGTLFVSNCNGKSIQRVTAEGESTLFVSSPLLKCPNGITIDEDGNLYVANFGNGDVIKITTSGHVSRLATIPGDNNGHLTYYEGELFVVARSNHQIYRVSLDGDVSLFAGTGERGRNDGPALEATFSYPNDIVVGSDGSFYVNDVVPHTGPHTILAPMIVRRITPVRQPAD